MDTPGPDLAIDDPQRSGTPTEPDPAHGRGSRTLLAAAVLGLGGAALGAVLGIARTKALAVSLGAVGFGPYGQVLSLLTTLSAAAGLGLGIGTTKVVAEARARRELDRLATVLAVSVAVPIVIGLVLGAALAISAPWSGEALMRDNRLILVLLAAVAVPWVAVQGALLHALQGFRDVLGVQAAGLVYGVVLTGATLAGGLAGGLIGAVAALAASNVVYTVALWVRLRSFAPELRVGRTLRTGLRRSILRDPTIRAMLGLGFASLGIGVLGGAWEIVVRTLLLHESSKADAGIWQGLNQISNQGVGVILSSVVFFGFTAVAEAHAVDRRERTRALIDDSLRLALLLVLPLLLALGMFAPHIISAFLDTEFSRAGDLLPFQLVGDFFRCIGWVVGSMLVPLGLIRPWILISVGTTLASLVVGAIAVPTVGLEGGVAAYVAMTALSSIWTCAWMWRLGHFRIRGRTLVALALGGVFLGLTWVPTLAPGYAAAILVGGSLVLGLTATSAEERRSVVAKVRDRLRGPAVAGHE